MPVTRPLLFSVPLVSIRLTRLWTILYPVSVVLAQPALRAGRKVMSITLHTVHMCAVCAACAALICTTASCISLSCLSFSASRCLRCLSHLSFSASRCACLCVLLRLSWMENGRGRISMHPAEPLGRCVFWRCRPHRIFMWETQTYCGSVGSGGADTYK